MLLEIGVMAATVALAMAAKGAERRRRSVALRTFEQYARTRSLRFVPPPPRPRGAGPRVEGVHDGASFVFDLYRVGSDVRTRVTANVARGVAPTFSIVQRGVLTRTAARDGASPFERAYAVSGATAEEQARLLETVASQLVLLDRREGVMLVSSAEKVTLSWSGVERSPVLYDAARDAALAVAGWHRPETPYR